jgi:hypothetical protein
LNFSSRASPATKLGEIKKVTLEKLLNRTLRLWKAEIKTNGGDFDEREKKHRAY